MSLCMRPPRLYCHVWCFQRYSCICKQGLQATSINLSVIGGSFRHFHLETSLLAGESARRYRAQWQCRGLGLWQFCPLHADHKWLLANSLLAAFWDSCMLKLCNLTLFRLLRPLGLKHLIEETDGFNREDMMPMVMRVFCTKFDFFKRCWPAENIWKHGQCCRFVELCYIYLESLPGACQNQSDLREVWPGDECSRIFGVNRLNQKQAP